MPKGEILVGVNISYHNLRGSSHYVAQVERLSSKILSRGEERSPLKYIISVLLSNFEYFIEKKCGLWTRVWISIFIMPKFLPRVQTLGAKTTKKCCHVGTLEAFHLWTLENSMKAERLESYYRPIKLLHFLHLSLNGHSVKCS